MAGIGWFWSLRVNLSQIRLQNTGLTTSPTDKTTPAFGFTTWAIEFSVAQTENSVAQTVGTEQRIAESRAAFSSKSKRWKCQDSLPDLRTSEKGVQKRGLTVVDVVIVAACGF